MRVPFRLGIAMFADSEAPQVFDDMWVNPCLFAVLDHGPTRGPFTAISWITMLEFVHYDGGAHA